MYNSCLMQLLDRVIEEEEASASCRCCVSALAITEAGASASVWLKTNP
jgi:hypothetical protein